MGASSPRSLQQVRAPAVPQHLDPIEPERRAGTVPREPLAPLIVIDRDAHGAVHVEPVARRRGASLASFQVSVMVLFELNRSREERPTRERELRARLLR